MPRATGFKLALALLALSASTVGQTKASYAEQPASAGVASAKVLHKTVKVGDLNIFYREAGPKDAPAVLLLHGFPTSSQMFRNLIPALGDRYYVVAPDYPGYGHSSMPLHDKFSYTFDNLANRRDRRVDAIISRKTRGELGSQGSQLNTHGDHRR